MLEILVIESGEVENACGLLAEDAYDHPLTARLDIVCDIAALFVEQDVQAFCRGFYFLKMRKSLYTSGARIAEVGQCRLPEIMLQFLESSFAGGASSRQFGEGGCFDDSLCRFFVEVVLRGEPQAVRNLPDAERRQ